MPVSRVLVSLIIVLVVVVILGSLAYPIVNSPFFSTQPMINTSLYAITLVTKYGISSYGVSYYSQITVNSVYLPGDCSGPFIGPFPPCYYIIPATRTNTLSRGFTVTSTSTIFTTSTSEQIYTNQVTKTAYQNIPMYAAIGLSSPQFVLIAVLVMVIMGIAIVYACKGVLRPRRV